MSDGLDIVERNATELGPDLREQMLRLFVRAFSGEPMFVYMFPDPARRPAQVRWSVERKWALMAPRYRLVLALQGDIVRGLSWWYAPGTAITSSVASQLAAGYAWAPFRFGLSVFGRMYRCGGQEQQLLQRIAAEPNWLLDVIAVDPDAGRAGIGGRLLQPVFDRADANGEPSWVITHNLRNVGFYAKNGYMLQFEEPVFESGPIAYVLRWPPAPR